MFILPVENKIDLKKPPIITFILIALNVLFFVFGQGKDDLYLNQAYQYYLSSPLVEQEGKLYLTYQKGAGHTQEATHFQSAWDDKNTDYMMLAMLQDDNFQRYLAAYYQSYPKQALPHRQVFEDKLNKAWTYRFGYKPAKPDPVALFFAMFLHGSFMHIFGNMLFLFIAGFTVERALGKWKYLTLYLLAGVAGNLLHAALNSTSVAPLVGASGAVSGLMGAYAAIYRMRWIRFFYWIGVYFDYVRLPAFMVLLVWVAKEIVQSKTSEMQQVAYWAHVGGLLSGALLVLLFDLFAKKNSQQVLVEETKREVTLSAYDLAMQRVNKYMKAMEITQAKSILYRLLQQNPDDVQVLEKLYQLEKFQPQTDSYYKIAWRLFALQDKSATVQHIVMQCFDDFVERSRRVNQATLVLPADTLIPLIGRIIDENRTEQADVLFRQLLTMQNLSAAQQERIVSLMYRMTVYLQKRQEPLWHSYLAELKQRFPHSQEVKWCDDL